MTTSHDTKLAARVASVLMERKDCHLANVPFGDAIQAIAEVISIVRPDKVVHCTRCGDTGSWMMFQGEQELVCASCGVDESGLALYEEPQYFGNPPR